MKILSFFLFHFFFQISPPIFFPDFPSKFSLSIFLSFSLVCATHNATEGKSCSQWERSCKHQSVLHCKHSIERSYQQHPRKFCSANCSRCNCSGKPRIESNSHCRRQRTRQSWRQRTQRAKAIVARRRRRRRSGLFWYCACIVLFVCMFAQLTTLSCRRRRRGRRGSARFRRRFYRRR